MAEAPGPEALRQIDAALAKRPDKDDAALSAATVALARLRDGMIRAQRSGTPTPGSRERLEHVNGIISAVMGVHYPLGAVPWPELECARTWLAAVVAQGEG